LQSVIERQGQAASEAKDRHDGREPKQDAEPVDAARVGRDVMDVQEVMWHPRDRRAPMYLATQTPKERPLEIVKRLTKVFTKVGCTGEHPEIELSAALRRCIAGDPTFISEHPMEPHPTRSTNNGWGAVPSGVVGRVTGGGGAAEGGGVVGGGVHKTQGESCAVIRTAYDQRTIPQTQRWWWTT
jgi:hypothetical protein